MFNSESSSIKKGTEVLKDVYFFSENQMLDCNQYLIRNEDTDELTLFDAGNGKSFNGLLNGMKKLNLNPEKITKVYLTHEHVDHVLGLYFLIEHLTTKPQLFAFGETAKILSKGDEKKIFPGNLGITARMFGVQIKPLEVFELTEGEAFEGNPNFSFKVLYTPGHSLGSACYYFPERKMLIPGDVVFIQGSFGRYDFPGGSLNQLINSISRLTSLDVKYLLPGHMGITDKGNQSIQFSYKMIQTATFF